MTINLIPATAVEIQPRFVLLRRTGFAVKNAQALGPLLKSPATQDAN
jgi:hypothetical protein